MSPAPVSCPFSDGSLDRRTMLAGLAVAALPAVAMPHAQAVWRALDDAARAQPIDGLAALHTIDVRQLSHARRLDVEAARAGLAIDAALATRPDDLGLRVSRTLGRIDIATAIRRLDAALRDLHARASAAFDVIGMNGANPGARFQRLFAEPERQYADSDTGRAQAIGDMTATLAHFRSKTPRLIGDVPPFCLDVAVRSLTPAEIAAGKQGYRTPPAPGRPGAYIVDLCKIARRPAWSLPSVVAHELLPGHMVQLGIEEVARPHPLRLRYASAFVEGWATYAETLVDYPDPRALLGHLHWLIFRAARGRVDLGIHAQGWSLDRARAAFAEWQGEPVYFAAFEADLARIVKDPGTRAAEALAWLALADRAPRAPARRVAWHAAVLANGRKRLEQLP
ncbi:DUF885 family protein [Sphingomonas sp. RHCKR47]|uniref:DUF885 family protein n=1 Tax=Sphingomonas citricola TaxID=2862498 RepID=UPI001CA5C335|nr:DUF885 family protein [Sphingomonas citricola]MBW6525119.1 DUF885 family protein [Sphingomonas citricola]